MLPSGDPGRHAAGGVRVLLVSNGFPPGGQWGTEFYTHQLAVGLSRRGHEVHVLHPSRESGRARFSLRSGVRYGVTVHEIANRGDPWKRFAESYRSPQVERVFDELIERLSPDVVHFLHLLWGLSLRLPAIGRARGAATCATVTDLGLLCHRGQRLDASLSACEGTRSPAECARCVRRPGPFEHRAPLLFAKRAAVQALAAAGGLGVIVREVDLARRALAVREALASVQHWLVPTRALARAFDDAGLPLSPTSIAPYGLDERAFDSARRAPDGPPRVVYTAQYEPHKGLDVLVEAAARLSAPDSPVASRPWTIELYGNGTRGRHRRFAPRVLARLPRGRVVDRGPFEPLRAPGVLARASCLVVPSIWLENAPLSLLQARAAGVPLVASDVGGVREVLEEGRHGTLVPPGDPVALAEALIPVLRGEVPRRVEPDPLVSWDEHLTRVEAIHRSLVRTLVPLAPAPARRTRAGSGGRA